MRKTCLILATFAVLAAPGAAQHDGHAGHFSPYAGQQDSGIAALSADEVEQLRAGAGMAMARAAELNHYPGPRHVLEMAAELDLSAEQHGALEAVHADMLTEARHLGAEIVAAEEHLQRRFALRHVDEGSLRRAVAEIARLYGELRFVHLAAHLQTTDLLGGEQIERYDRLRGYR